MRRLLESYSFRIRHTLDNISSKWKIQLETFLDDDKMKLIIRIGILLKTPAALIQERRLIESLRYAYISKLVTILYILENATIMATVTISNGLYISLIIDSFY